MCIHLSGNTEIGVYPMIDSGQIVVFIIDEQRYGIPLSTVERVVRMVEITPLPGASEFILGVINVEGEVVPVIDLRGRFGLPRRPVGSGDQLIVTRLAGRKYALVADAARDVREFPSQALVETADILPDIPLLAGVAKLPDGMILLNDPEKLISPDERKMLDNLAVQEPA